MTYLFPKIKTYYKALVIKTLWYKHDIRHIDQWNKIVSPELNLHIFGQMIFDKGARPFNREWTIFPINGTGKSG